jgi:hypothetical protein
MSKKREVGRGGGGLQVGRTDEAKIKETKQIVWYARWPLAAKAINTISHHPVTSDITGKYKNICNRVRPPGPFRTVGPR